MRKRPTHTTPQGEPGRAVHNYVLLGGGIGMACGGTFALLLGASGPMVASGAVLGIATGLVAGLLSWIGAADLPEEPIPGVRAGDRERRPVRVSRRPPGA